MTEYHIITRIQSIFRGNKYRRNNLPNSIRSIHKYLESCKLSCSSTSQDGRTNSCLDENYIIQKLLESSFKERLYIPESRHWFDMAIRDFKYGWLPINIKSTTTQTADNTGNLAMCVYALTNYDMEIKSSYQNGNMSKKLIDGIINKHYNYNLKRDYYFIVINKDNSSVISNSLKGLTDLTPNINNLPFQVKWCNNKNFKYKSINEVIEMIKQAIKKPNPSWRETFLTEIRNIE